MKDRNHDRIKVRVTEVRDGKEVVRDLEVWPGAVGNALAYLKVKPGATSLRIETSDVEGIDRWAADFGADHRG